MYAFGVVVTDVDETPTGHASEVLRAELPGRLQITALNFSIQGSSRRSEGSKRAPAFSYVRVAGLQ
jgi:hypothetical protein